MPVNLADVIRRVRSRLDESVAALYSNAEIADWINDTLRDMARRTEDLQSFDPTTIVIVPGTAKYALPSDVIRVHRAEFVPTGSTQNYPIKASTYAEMDQIWGINQQQQSSYPSYFVIWGFPSGTGKSAHQIQFFPIPAQAGVVNLFYYRLPYRFLNPDSNPGELAKTVEIVEGWDDVLVQGAYYQALKKDRDQTWKDEKVEYEEKIGELIDLSRQWHDQQRMVTTGTGFNQPQWLYQFGD